MSTGHSTGAARWDRLSAAAAFALTIHARQTRKGTDIPYISHLLGVASLVLEHGGDEDQAIAGLLHDAVEDQGAHQAAAIAERFGPRVAAIVLGCTDADTVPKPPWHARKESYIAHLQHADPEVLLVSCADKLHNARAIRTDLRTYGLTVYDRFTGGQDGTLWYTKHCPKPSFEGCRGRCRRSWLPRSRTWPPTARPRVVVGDRRCDESGQSDRRQAFDAHLAPHCRRPATETMERLVNEVRIAAQGRKCRPGSPGAVSSRRGRKRSARCIPVADFPKIDP